MYGLAKGRSLPAGSVSAAGSKIQVTLLCLVLLSSMRSIASAREPVAGRRGDKVTQAVPAQRNGIGRAPSSTGEAGTDRAAPGLRHPRNDGASIDGSDVELPPGPAWLVKALEGSDKDPHKLEKAVRKHTKGKYSVPLYCMRHALRLTPMDSRFPFLVGCSLLHLGQDDKALRFIEEAIAAAPNNPEPVNLKAEYLRVIGDLDGYIRTLKRSLALDGKQRKIRFKLARALLTRNAPGDETRALAMARAAVGDSPGLAEELAESFHSKEARLKMLDLAAELRTNQALERLHRATGGPRYGRVRSAVAPGAKGSASGPYPVTRVGSGVGASSTSYSGRYSVMKQGDEYRIIKAGNLPRYEKLRRLRASRRAARSGSSASR